MSRRGNHTGRTHASSRSIRGGALAVALAALLAVLTGARAAHAELTVGSIEHGPWPVTVAALQTNLNSEGATLRVVVSDESGRRAPCGGYVLTFDRVGEAAFGLGACDPATQATLVVLRHRSALFEHGDIVARPLAVGITAIETRSTSVSGAAAAGGGSEVACSVAVRPFLRDMESGAVVHLPPGRFALRPLASGVTAVVDTDGWNLVGATAGLVIDYEVVDTQRREVVLRDRATLSCSSSPVTPGAPPRLDPACPDVVTLIPGTPARGSTRDRPSRYQPRCGGSTPNPEQVFALLVPSPARVSLRLASDYDGVLSVRSGCGMESADEGCNDDTGDTRHSALDLTLAAGVHYVYVDGWGTSGAGSYSLVATVTPLGGVIAPAVAVAPPTYAAPPPVIAAPAPPAALLTSTCADAQPLPPNGSVTGTTEGYSHAFGASCGAGARSPERVFALTLTRRARVRLRLSTRFDGVLYVRSGCDGGREIACNDDDPDTQHSALDVTLDAGTWYVFVDGYSQSNAGRFELHAEVDERRGAFELRGGVSFGSAGTPLGIGVGYSAAARGRVSAAFSQIGVGVRFGVETFNGRVDSTPRTIDLTVLTVGLPLVFNVPLFNEALGIYGSAEPALLFSRATVTEGTTTSSDRATTASLSLGGGVEYHPVRWFGVYSEYNYRFADVALLGPEQVLANGGAYHLGFNAMF